MFTITEYWIIGIKHLWFILVTMISILFSSYSVATTTEKCVLPQETLKVLFGDHANVIVSYQSPFVALASNLNATHILWINEQQQSSQVYSIQKQGGDQEVVVIAASCSQIFPELVSAVQVSRQVLGNQLTLGPGSRFVEDLGLSLDQIAAVQAQVFAAAEIAMPEELYATYAELATYIKETPAVKNRGFKEDKAFHVQTVYYGTTRARDDKRGAYYGKDRDIEIPIHYGKAEVSIPFNHEKGSIEQPFLSIEWFQDSDKHVLIRSVSEMGSDEFWSQLPVKADGTEWDNSIIVYLHGYNVAFNAAIKRTAQMAYDFNFTGVPLLFSWPSNAKLLDYAADREDAIWSATHFAGFLARLHAENPKTNIHIIAHSMGNQVLLNALDEMSLKEETKHLKFSSVVLAAPDVDSEWFQFQLAERVTRLADRWALYTSENDGALIASNKVNQAKRLGMPVSLIENIDVIDTSGLNAAPWSIPESHSYYANKLTVIEDLVEHIKGVAPGQRTLTEVVTEKGRYWTLAE